MLLLANSLITPRDNHDPGTMPGVVVLAFYISIPICSGAAGSAARY